MSDSPDLVILVVTDDRRTEPIALPLVHAHRVVNGEHMDFCVQHIYSNIVGYKILVGSQSIVWLIFQNYMDQRLQFSSSSPKPMLSDGSLNNTIISFDITHTKSDFQVAGCAIN